MFKGHEFIKVLTDNWVFDFTEFIGYKVTLDNKGRVKSYERKFKTNIIDNKLVFEKEGSVPLKVLKETSLFINRQVSLMGV